MDDFDFSFDIPGWGTYRVKEIQPNTFKCEQNEDKRPFYSTVNLLREEVRWGWILDTIYPSDNLFKEYMLRAYINFLIEEHLLDGPII